MTAGKASALAAALVGAVALGVAIGPTVQDKWLNKDAPTVAREPAHSVESPAVKPAVKTERPERRAAAAGARALAAPKKNTGTIQWVAVPLWEPEFRDRVKAVLNPGTRLELAAADFENAEQFMTVAHAARDTQVPFMLLKDRVLNKGQSLADAIHEFKPELDAKAQATRARAAARLDIAS